MVPASPSMLLEAIQKLVEELPRTAITSLARALEGTSPGDWTDVRARAQGAVAHPYYRGRVGSFIDIWHDIAPALLPTSIALALESGALVAAALRRAQTLDLVWTGPQRASLRRTDQALLELIDSAQSDLLIVTFAAYKIPEIRAALARALGRGVRLRLVIESPLESEGKVAYDGLAALGPDIVGRARVYRWPLEARPEDAAGRHGSLHAKCAVADEHSLLISSANLTEYALTLNMEMGVLITGTTLPSQVAQHFSALIQTSVLVDGV